MPSTLKMYHVWNDGKVIEGAAADLLEEIRAEGAKTNEELRKMSTDQYTRAVIEDAPYFLEKSLLEALKDEEFSSDADRALTYLSSVPSSRIRILSEQ